MGRWDRRTYELQHTRAAKMRVQRSGVTRRYGA
jgi:hypothetical protein